MKVSIITIVYNNKESIQSCIDSVHNQTYKNIEYLVIDGGSVDGTQEIIEENKDKITTYISEPDNGLYNALNKGIKMATGEVIGVLHSDDLFYANDTIERYAKAFVEEQADVVYADGMYVERDNVKKVKRVYKGKEYLNSNLNLGWMPLHTTIFVKKEVYQKHGLYDESYHIAGDYDCCLRWFKDKSLKKVHIPHIMVLMRLGGKSTTAKLQKKKSTEDLEIIRKHKLWGSITLLCKIVRKIPQYIKPKFKKYKL